MQSLTAALTFFATCGATLAQMQQGTAPYEILESDPILPSTAYRSSTPMLRHRNGRDLSKSQAGTNSFLIIKFVDNAHLRANGTETVISSDHANDACASQVSALAANLGVRLHSLVAKVGDKLEDLMARAASLSHKHQRDLRGLTWVELSNDDVEHLVTTANSFKAHGCVEYITFESKMVPEEPSYCSTPALVTLPAITPSFMAKQTYRGPDPGMDIAWAAELGADGEGIRLYDVEYGVDVHHEDLAKANVIEEVGFEGDPRDHGTAAVSISVGTNNEFGITGSAPKAQAYFFSEIPSGQSWDRPRAVAEALSSARPGDVVLLEMQTWGACSAEDGKCNSGGRPYVLAEYDQEIFELVRTAADADVIVVAAAGNGNADLDAPEYAAYRARGDSGAIIVGAGVASKSHAKTSFSTYGSRVDVQGWGDWSVTAAGYGACHGGWGSSNRSYTYSFAGTSSASALVAAAAVALQSFSKKALGRLLKPLEMRALLKSTGVAQNGGGNIGPHVNLKSAISALMLRRPFVKLTSGSCPQDRQVSKEVCLAAAKTLGADASKTHLDGGSDEGLKGRPQGCTLHSGGNVEWWGPSDAVCGSLNYACVCRKPDVEFIGCKYWPYSVTASQLTFDECAQLALEKGCTNFGLNWGSHKSANRGGCKVQASVPSGLLGSACQAQTDEAGNYIGSSQNMAWYHILGETRRLETVSDLLI